MKHILLGRSGLRVSELCLGGLTFGEPKFIKKENFSSERQSFAVLEHFAGAGGNFIDTSSLYGNGSSEKIIGEFVKQERNHFVIGTKFSLSEKRTPSKTGNSRKNMILSVEQSLRNLNTDYIDMLWLHIWDEVTPAEEFMRGFDDLVSSGKILYAGISSAPAWKICQAKTIADLRGWSPLIGIQISYSLFKRDAERELLPMAKELELGITAFEVFARGSLLPKPQGNPPDTQGTSTHIATSDKNHQIREVILALSKEIEAPPARIALAYVLQNRRYGKIIPIVGARTQEQIKENLECINLKLSSEHLQMIDSVSAVDLGYPHTAISHSQTKKLLGDEDLLI